MNVFRTCPIGDAWERNRLTASASGGVSSAARGARMWFKSSCLSAPASVVGLRLANSGGVLCTSSSLLFGSGSLTRSASRVLADEAHVRCLWEDAGFFAGDRRGIRLEP